MDSSALRVLCSVFRGPINGFLRGRYFKHDPEAVDEVWNDTLAAAYQQIETFDPRRSLFRTWLFTLARRQAQAWTRQRTQQQRGDTAASGIEMESIVEGPEVAVIAGEERDAMRRAFSDMPERDQRLLFLRHVLGCRHAEIARSRLGEVTGEGSVRVYVNRATLRLNETFHQERDSPAGGGLARDPDEVVPIELVVAAVEAAGETGTFACLEAEQIIIPRQPVRHGLERPFLLPRDVGMIGELAAEHEAALLIVDPLRASGRVNRQLEGPVGAARACTAARDG